MKSALRRYSVCLALSAALCGLCGWVVLGQNNWPTQGGDAQRSSSVASDTAINKDSVKDLRLLWKVKLETSSNGLRPVLPPLILNRLISYRGFKELAFVGTNADVVYAVDADLGKIFWTRHLEYSVQASQVTKSTPECPGGLTATPTMPVGSSNNANAGGRGNPFVGGAASVYAISSDGRLHRLNLSTGDDMAQPVSVLPANAHASSLTMVDNVIYTTTTNECNGAPNAVWAIDLAGDGPKARSFPLDKRSAGTAVIGGNGTVYVKTTEASRVPVAIVEGLSGRSLEKRTVFKLLYEDSPATGSTLAAFSHGGKSLLASTCGEGLCLMDAASFVPEDQIKLASDIKPVLARVLVIEPGEGRGLNGQLATWQDRAPDSTRWILASVVGPPRPELKGLVAGEAPKNGFIAAFKVQEKDGKPTLTLAWISRDMESPQPPVVVNGVVFALSAGEFTRRRTESGAIEEKPKRGAHATLYALDARTGKELYSSRNLVTAPAALGGLTAANGRVYFGGLDGELYAFGMYMEH